MTKTKRKAPTYDEDLDGFKFTKTRKTKHDDATRILLPTSDTPIIRRNKEMRRSIVNGDRRRSSSGMRGRRASSLIDEGRSNALPHSDVPSSELYKIISPDLTEPRRMRLLLGWCGDRARLKKPAPPASNEREASEQFQAEQAAQVIQEELTQELSSNGLLSEWFSRDTETPPTTIFLRKKPHPRNIANAAKVKELELHLERLKAERQAWEAILEIPSPKADSDTASLSPLNLDLLSSPERHIYDQLQARTEEVPDQHDIVQRLQDISRDLEFSVDLVSHSVHAVDTTRQVAERIAEQSLGDAATILQQRHEGLAAKDGPRIDALDALKGLARVLNAPP